jgi:hypothetical protein
MHDEFINKYIIVKDDKTITLIPLPHKKKCIIVTLNWKGKVRPEKENSLYCLLQSSYSWKIKGNNLLCRRWFKMSSALPWKITFVSLTLRGPNCSHYAGLRYGGK